MKKLTVLALTLTVATAATAQMPARGKASASVGGKAVSIDFGQAKLGARSLDEMMKGLPADGVWRAGRDQVTTLTTEGPITIGGKAVPAGKYSLYVPVGKDGSYSLAVNKHPGVPLKSIFAGASAAMANEPWPILQDYDKNIGKDEVARVVRGRQVGDGARISGTGFGAGSKGPALRVSGQGALPPGPPPPVEPGREHVGRGGEGESREKVHHEVVPQVDGRDPEPESDGQENEEQPAGEAPGQAQGQERNRRVQ
jgi:hypothetical protein